MGKREKPPTDAIKAHRRWRSAGSRKSVALVNQVEYSSVSGNGYNGTPVSDFDAWSEQYESTKMSTPTP